MLGSYKKFYCPHCNAPLDTSKGFRPEECPFCRGVIRHRKGGEPVKGLYKGSNLSLKTNDTIVIIILVCVVAYTIYHILF